MVNEAMACGLPAVVSTAVGCQEDLIGATTAADGTRVRAGRGPCGETFVTEDVRSLSAALTRLRQRLQEGERISDACRTQVSRFSFEAATRGLLEAARMTVPRLPSQGDEQGLDLDGVRVLVACGGMVLFGGLERQTFEVLRALRDRGAAVHCLLNDWQSHRIKPVAESIGATWEEIPYRSQLSRHERNPLKLMRTAWQILTTERATRVAMRAFRPTVVFIPEIGALLRGALGWRRARRRRIEVIFRIGNAPERGPAYRFLWSKIVPRLVDYCVANSKFGLIRLRQEGVPPGQTRLIRNSLATRDRSREVDLTLRSWLQQCPTLLTVGQIAPFKGTDLFVGAAIELIQAGHDIQAAVVGRVPTWPPARVKYVSELRARILAADCEDRIRFLGERSDVASIMGAAHLFVAPIRQEETFGNVVLEAAHAGLASITTARGGLPELVVPGVTGWIVEPIDQPSLVSMLKERLSDPDGVRRAGAQAAERVVRATGPYGRATFRTSWQALTLNAHKRARGKRRASNSP